MACYLKLFVDVRERYQKLSDAEFGRLIRAALTYKSEGVEVKLQGREELMWDGMKLDIDRDNERQKSVNDSRAEAGRKGAESRWQKDGKNSKCHLPYSKNSYDKDKEEEEDKDKDKDKDKNNPPKSPQGDLFVDFAGEDRELLEALREFEAMRKAIKKPMTGQAKKNLVGKLQRFSEPYHAKQRYMVECLHESILNDWQSVYELKDFQDSEPDRPPVVMNWVVPNPDSYNWEDLVP